MTPVPPGPYCLLVIDMQEHFRDRMAEQIVDPLNNLIDVCDAQSVPVVFTQHGHVDPAQDDSVLVRWWGPDNSIQYVVIHTLHINSVGCVSHRLARLSQPFPL